MRHGVKKIKFNSGYDANRMLMRKLALSFLSHGYLETTVSKAKALKTHLELLVSKMKTKTESNKNILLKFLGDIKVVEDGFKRIGPAVSKINGGYVRVIKLGARASDGSLIARIEWTNPIINEDENKKVKEVKKESIKTLSSKVSKEDKTNKKTK